ncbi:Hsp70/Hsp90 co-chaperone CNS1 AltName: Full=Cyclophilin seven suppressor 1 [Rhizoctonia solani AG-1 IB]|uniref:CNS1 protein n=1 Tax=Thanatephorus cucumeris (strain AG1-IB / isolate 7/3/14) TaxID=1108050 RepID=M5BJL9_THACB|nr:Hsp70/Hsp90 co-chaperone CNS1 AltName: Full=Cyclophilin seven suppressor 1 [Rhizoctonia solani AG-1 IB]
MALTLKDEDGRPYMIRIKQRGMEHYDPERVALMTEGPPPQPEGRKLEEIPTFMQPWKRFPLNFPDNSHLPIFGEKELFRGTSNTIALEFKNKGNNFFRRRKWWDAREAYIEAFEFGPDDPELVEVLWLNMAAANIELKYWPGVLGPAAKAITLNLKSIKGYFRAARALVHYERYEEAIDCCKR